MLTAEAPPQGSMNVAADASRPPMLLFCILFACLTITAGYAGPTEWTTDAAQVATTIEASGGGGLGRSRPIALLILGAIGCLALLRGRQPVALCGVTGLAIVLFIGLMIASFLWAEDSGTVMRRTVAALLLLAAVAGAARVMTLPELRIFVCFSFGLSLAMGFAAELVMGAFMPINPEYRFHGLTNANSQGLIAGMLLLAVLASDFGRRRGLRWLLIAAILLLIVLARSRGAMAATLAGLLVWQMLSGRSAFLFVMKGVLAVSILLPLAFLLAGENFGSSAENAVLMGREDRNNDPTSLSGRMPLWSVLIEHYVVYRPLAGYGFQGFWTPDHIIEISAYQDWAIIFAHSAYVDILLELGILGLILFCAIVIGALLVCVRRSAGADGREWAFAGALLAAVAVNSLLETVLLAPTIQSFAAMVVIVKAAALHPDLRSALQRQSRALSPWHPRPHHPPETRTSPAGGLS